MTASTTIYQCQICNRQFEAAADGSLLPAARPSLHVEFLDGCARADCHTAAREFEAQAAADAQREVRTWTKALANHRARHAAKKECRTATVRPPGRLDESRLPYPKDTECGEALPPAPAVGVNVGAAVETVLTARTLGQRDFEARGAADSANELLVAWFRRPENFGKWFTKKFLEDVVMRGKSGCCNNRAKDCRDRYDWGGNYIDNKMIEVDGRLQSHYALMRLEDAVSLTDEEKRRRMNAEFRNAASGAPGLDGCVQ